MADAQKLLESFIDAPDDGVQYWEDLSEVIRTVVHKAVSKREISDLEDFEEDCVLAIWSRIISIKTGDSQTHIENLEAFVRRSVHNRYCDVIRRKRPRWYNLKLELLEIFSGKANVKGFALWQNPDTGERICGFDVWANKIKPNSSKCKELSDKPNGFRKFINFRNPNELPTYELAAEILKYCASPIDIDNLTNCITDLTQSRILEPFSLDVQISEEGEMGSPVDYLISTEIAVEKQIVDNSWFEHVVEWFWKEFQLLNMKQRKAIIYGLASDQVMALISSIGINKLSASMEMTAAEFVILINQLPIPDSRTAEELQLQPKAIPSIRFKAWERIRRRTKKSNLVENESI